MVPRSDSVPVGSPPAPPIPHWFQWLHPDLRLWQNAVIVVARLHGFSVGDVRPKPGQRFSMWEARWANTYLIEIGKQSKASHEAIWDEVHAIEKKIGEIVRQLANEGFHGGKGGGA